MQLDELYVRLWSYMDRPIGHGGVRMNGRLVFPMRIHEKLLLFREVGVGERSIDVQDIETWEVVHDSGVQDVRVPDGQGQQGSDPGGSP